MSSASADAETWGSAWERALTELELNVDEAEALLVADHTPLVAPSQWAPPTGLGPLPADLRERAQALLSRQIEVATRTASAAVQSRRHAAAVKAMRAQPPASPVYFDREG